MPSFDIVSEVDLQEARNAVDNASREVESRFDFRGVEATFELNDANKTIKVLSESDFQVNQLLDILRRHINPRQPTPVPRVTVIPSHGVLHAARIATRLQI